MTTIIPHPAAVKDIILGCGLCILIFSVIFAFPLLGVFALLFLPLPVLYYRLKLGRNSAGIIVGVSLMVLLIMARGIGFDLLYFGALLMTGFVLGECIERQLGIQHTMVYTASLVIGAAGVVFWIYTLIRGVSAEQVISDYMAQYFSLTSELYSDMGIESHQIDHLNTAFMVVMPGMFTISYLTTVWLNILIIRRMLLRIGIPLQNLANLNQFRPPHALVWGVIGLSATLLMPLSSVKYVSINCLIVIMLVYFFQGIAIISFFFEKKNFPPLLRVLCYTLIAAQIYFLILVIGLGFFDTWINFRKLGREKDTDNFSPGDPG